MNEYSKFSSKPNLESKASLKNKILALLTLTQVFINKDIFSQEDFEKYGLTLKKVLILP